jgi:hypothetical protein
MWSSTNFTSSLWRPQYRQVKLSLAKMANLRRLPVVFRLPISENGNPQRSSGMESG